MTVSITTRTLAAAALLAATLLAANARAQDDDEAPGPTDTIETLINGKVRMIDDVIVTSAGYDKVTYTARRKTVTLTGDKVRKVSWGDEPSDFAPGWRALAAGHGLQARKAFQLCMDAKVAHDLRDWIDEYANVGLGEAYRLLAAEDPKNLDKAAAAYGAARTANPKSLLINVLLEGLADVEAARGNGPKALAAARDLVTAAKIAKRPSWELDGLLLQAKIQLGLSQHADAARAFEAVVRFADNQLALTKDEDARRGLEKAKRQAAAAQGWVLVNKGVKSKSSADFDAARRYFDGLPAKFNQSWDVLAARSNAHGVIKYETGDSKGAIRHFQFTEVNYFTVAGEVARALYYQALCNEKLGKQKAKAERIRDLKEYYPRSEWARKLRK